MPLDNRPVTKEQKKRYALGKIICMLQVLQRKHGLKLLDRRRVLAVDDGVNVVRYKAHIGAAVLRHARLYGRIICTHTFFRKCPSSYLVVVEYLEGRNTLPRIIHTSEIVEDNLHRRRGGVVSPKRSRCELRHPRCQITRIACAIEHPRLR